MLKAVLFDIDDTLIDWSEFSDDWTLLEMAHISRAFELLSSELGITPDHLHAFTNEFRARTVQAWTSARSTLVAPNVGRVLVEAAIALGAPSDRIELQRVLQAYGWRAVPGTRVFPEVHDVMRALTKAGIKVGMVTNAFQPMLLREIELGTDGHGILEYFTDCRVSAADVGYLKPHKAIFEHALEKIGTTPEETVFVGDDPEADIVGAQGVGMKAVLRYTERRPFLDDDDEIKPDAIVRDLHQLLPLLDHWYPDWRTANAQTQD